MQTSKILLKICSLALFGYVTQGPARAISANHQHHHPEGGRQGLHGMVLFGKTSHFLEHIPMLTPPHDFQIIAQVILKNSSGVILRKDFSNGTFTLKPSTHFSLNDYAEGRLTKFTGHIYLGGFEQDGKVIPGLENVTVEVTSILLARQLPSSHAKQSFEIPDGDQVFVTNIITPQRNTQTITNQTTGHTLWCVIGPDFFNFCN
ncbi:MAG: hypothetical protein AB7O96_04530 [Pseudobdellovibrionaceae bacterium]